MGRYAVDSNKLEDQVAGDRRNVQEKAGIMRPGQNVRQDLGTIDEPMGKMKDAHKYEKENEKLMDDYKDLEGSRRGTETVKSEPWQWTGELHGLSDEQMVSQIESMATGRRK